jgi:deoxyribose-phosphate aldolase
MNFDRAVARMIDHTILKPEAVRADVRQVAEEALKFEFASACVNPFWVPFVKQILRGSPVRVCTVVGFPLGATSTASKVSETLTALREGAEEIDMVINLGALRGGEFDVVREDIAAVTAPVHDQSGIVKVIIETALLDDEQKIAACKLAVEAGADFVKTSTGFSKSGATAADVALMRQTVGSHVGVKASGGVRTFEDFCAMVAAGATRVGASSSVKILEATDPGKASAGPPA